MSQIVYETLVGDDTPLPAGGSIQSDVIDTNGAGTVNLMFNIAGLTPSVQWTLFFGPTANGAFFPIQSGSFDVDNNVSISVPVFGPKLFVSFANGGSDATTAGGNIYFLREVT